MFTVLKITRNVLVVPYFFAATYYAFDLEKDEEFTPETLQWALVLDDISEARDIYDKLLECGF